MADDFNVLLASLSRASRANAVRPQVAKSKARLQARMRREAEGHKYASRLPSAISSSAIASGYGFEVGPRTGGAGSLAFYYFGNSKVGPSIPDPLIGLLDEAESFSQAAVDALIAELVA